MTVTSCIRWAYRFTPVCARVVSGIYADDENLVHEAKLKILYVTNELSYFRAHRENVAVAMAREGHQVIVAAGESAGIDITDWPRSMRLVSLELNKHVLSIASDQKLIRQLAKIIRLEKPDTVHAITIKPILMGALAARLLVPKSEQANFHFVWTFAGLGKIFEPSENLSIKFRKYIVTSALKYCRKRLRVTTTFENPADQKFMIEQRLATKTTSHLLMGTGLSLDHFKRSAKAVNSNNKNRPLVFLMATRLIKEKGVDVYLKAAQHYYENKTSDHRVKFLLAGTRDPSNPDSMDMELIKRAEASGFIEFVGAVEQQDMPALFNRADVFCLPTRLREGFPRSLLEAAACGCALIASDQETNRRIVLEGETGWLMPTADFQGLCDCMDKAIENKEKTIDIGANANNFVQQLPVRDEDIIDTFKAIYFMQ